MKRPGHDHHQLNLGLPPEQPSEATLRWCFDRIETRMTFNDFMKTPAGIALRAWARAIERRRATPRKDRA